MIEKKTFKNALVGSAHTDGARIEWLISGSGVFRDAEWDMEVTFTKKQPKPEIGGTCRWPECGGTLNCIILGVNGSWIWIAEDPEDEGWVVDVNDLKDIKPWNPV